MNMWVPPTFTLYFFTRCVLWLHCFTLSRCEVWTLCYRRERLDVHW